MQEKLAILVLLQATQQIPIRRGATNNSYKRGSYSLSSPWTASSSESISWLHKVISYSLLYVMVLMVIYCMQFLF